MAKKLMILLALGIALAIAVALLLRTPASPGEDERVASPVVEDAEGPAALPEPVSAPRSEPVRTLEPTRVDLTTQRTLITGVVTDIEQRRAVAGLRIDALVEGRRLRRSSTDSDGRFSIEVPQGSVRMTATPAGHAGWCEHLQLAEGESAAFVRELGGAPLSVRVWSSLGEALEYVPEAEVRVVAVLDDPAQHASCLLFEGNATAQTDGGGRARFTTVDGALHIVQVRATSHLSRTFVLDLERREIEDCVDVVLEPLGEPIRGRVLTPEGAPVAGALVLIDARRNGRDSFERYGKSPADSAVRWTELEPELLPPSVKTGSDGRYEIHGPRRDAPELVDATLIVYPQRAGLVHHHSLPLPKTTLSNARELDIRLPKAHEITVEFVYPDGVSLADGPASARDMDGRPFGPEPEFIAGQQLTQTAGRYFQTAGGSFKFLHGGGTVRVGISPGGVWMAQEVGIVVPPDGSKLHFRLTYPY